MINNKLLKISKENSFVFTVRREKKPFVLMRRMIGVWIITILSSVPVAFAQTGLFNIDTGVAFLTVGVFILIIFFIGDQIFKQMRGKK